MGSESGAGAYAGVSICGVVSRQFVASCLRLFFLDLRAAGVSLPTMVDALPRLGMWDSAISAERYFWFLAPSR